MTDVVDTDADADALPLSALQHWTYCPRQWALIHLEQSFDDNVHTLRGQAVHAQVDRPGFETTRGAKVERALPLWHDALGLIGKADVVEFIAGVPYPVEYKHGSRHKAADIAACDDVQLAAQAMCLESMTGVLVPEGALFYASSKRRRIVAINGELRARVDTAAAGIRTSLARGTLPPPLEGVQAERRCRGCSLRERCQPETRSNAALASLRQGLFEPD